MCSGRESIVTRETNNQRENKADILDSGICISSAVQGIARRSEPGTCDVTGAGTTAPKRRIANPEAPRARRRVTRLVRASEWHQWSRKFVWAGRAPPSPTTQARAPGSVQRAVLGIAVVHL